MSLSREEKLASIEAKMERLKLEKNAILKKEKEKERKARTKRLIEIGAEVESVYGEALTKEQIIALGNFLRQQDERGNWFSNALDSAK